MGEGRSRRKTLRLGIPGVDTLYLPDGGGRKHGKMGTDTTDGRPSLSLPLSFVSSGSAKVYVWDLESPCLG